MTKEEAKRAYKSLIKTFHPDNNNGENHEEIMTKITNDYENYVRNK